jgi:phosphoglycerate dehydrogenase-like enzyme
MNDSAPRLAFLSRSAYGEGTSEIPAIEKLVGLQNNGHIEIGPNILPELLPEVPPQLEKSCSALVCRPTWGGEVTAELVDRLRIPGQSFTVATLSSGRSNVTANDEVTVLNADEGNVEQTAELTVFLAICLLRRALAPMVNMGFGIYARPDLERARSLLGKTWLVVGPGAIGQSVLARASAMGAGELRAYHAKFSTMSDEEIAGAYPCLADLCVRFTGDLETALTGADVVTLHVPSNERTAGMVDDSWFRLLPPSAVLVNCARHEVVDEGAVMAALEDDRLQGYASDVLPSSSERPGANPHKPEVEIWQRACWSLVTSIKRCTHWPSVFENAKLAKSFTNGREPPVNRNERNMVYTPHLGGSTRDAEHAVAKNVIDRLLGELGVEP